MTTSQQGPLWQQGDQDAALRWLASLDQADQVALRRSMQTQRALAPIYDAVNRSIDLTRRAGRTLSEGAQSLATQARQYGRGAAEWAGRTGADLRDRAEVATALAAIRVNESLDRAGRAGARAAQGISAAAGRVSRWFQQRVSNTTGRAAAGYHAMKAFSAPDLNAQSAPTPGGPQLSANAITGVASQVHAFATAGSVAERQAALNALVGSMDKDNQAMLMAALINSGQAPAAGAVNATPLQAEGRGAPQQPGKGPELGK